MDLTFQQLKFITDYYMLNNHFQTIDNEIFADGKG